MWVSYISSIGDINIEQAIIKQSWLELIYIYL